jgi:hypothetical protein
MTDPSAPSAPLERIRCRWSQGLNDTSAVSCGSCGAPLDLRDLVSDSGWREAPRIRDMTKIRFGAGSACQVEGEIVPAAEIQLAASDSIYFEHQGPGLRRGIRIGIIARASEDEAWRVARRRFPPDRAGQLTHQLAAKVSDSVWHRRLSAADDPGGHPYWLVPFQNYKSMCPYLVGSHRRVGRELGRYVELGFDSVILDVPPDAEDLAQIRAAFPEWAAVGR